MIKVLIADDEERIINLIKVLGDWEKMDMEIAAVASDGLAAIEKIRQIPIDVLITDIRMPGISGLELIEKAVSVYPQIKVIIVSGYAHFEYAQMALRYGVKEYLLKPISEEALNNALENVRKQIRTEMLENVAIDNIKRERDENLYELREKLIVDLLEKQDVDLSFDVMRNKYHFNLSEGMYQAICIKIDSHSEKFGSAVRTALWDRILSIVYNKVKSECYDCYISVMDDYLYGFINYPVRTQGYIRTQVRSVINQIETMKEMYGDIRISVALGRPTKNITELKDSFRYAIAAIRQRLMESGNRLLECENIKPVLYNESILDAYTRRIGEALELLSTEILLKAVGEVRDEVTKITGVQGWEIFDLVIQMEELLILRMKRQDKDALMKQFLRQCENCSDLKSLFQTLEDFSAQQLEKVFLSRDDDQKRSVRIARQFIGDHYHEQITLEEVSEYVGLSPTYFSTVFKNETGFGFAKYVQDIRIKAAKELLCDTTFTVAEICMKVGYNDIKYFSKIFKKSTGVKPSIYRKLYG